MEEPFPLAQKTNRFSEGRQISGTMGHPRPKFGAMMRRSIGPRKGILMPRKALGRVGLIAVLFSLSIVPVHAAYAATERAYIGTYTPEPGSSQTQNHGEGIYLVSLDTATGALYDPRLVVKTRSPSWIA